MAANLEDVPRRPVRVGEGRRHLSATGQPYRAYALQRLHRHYATLPEAAARAVPDRVLRAGYWGTLW